MSIATNKHVVLDLLAALAAGDYERMLGYLHDEIRFYVIGSTRYSGLQSGKQALLENVLLPMGAQRGPGGFSEEILEIIGERDIVVTQSRGHKVTTAGQLYANEYAFIYRFEDGLVREWSCYLDTALLAATHD